MTDPVEREGYETLRVAREDDLLLVTLENPEKANALSPDMLRELTVLYRRPLREEGVRAVVLSGAGKHFSAGADLAHLRALQDASREEHRLDSQRLRGLFEAVLRQEALTVAAVHGSCVAGGCGLATAHDFVVATEDARFLYSEVRIGFVAALVATFLPLRVRGADLRELLLNPEFVPAPRALEIGLVNRVVPPGEHEAAAKTLAVEVLERASSQSIALTKGLLLDVLGRPLGDALDRAAEVNAAARATDDCKHGIGHFLEHKRPPVWR
ncbi:MAG TPA: enoyl-CoA hydratase/isomerase family protein [Thermoanaerobaculia bacterium]|nr:enoyl-CoA hydratase/isomerase family protein [Thermoanaerobaculia bacterium]